MQHGENPLDFIKKNIAARAGMEVVPAEALKAEEEKRAAAAPPPEPKVEEVPPASEPKVEEPPAEDAVSEDPDTSVATNFKKVRTLLNETKTELSTTKEDLTRTLTELDKYKSGEVLPDVLAAKEAEIARLSRYEKVVSLKTSPEYQEKYVKPLSQVHEQLGAIAKDYNIPIQRLNQALATTNRAELNKFLSSHFDDVGAIEVKQLINQAQGLQAQALEAEKEPQTAMERLIQEGVAAKTARMEKQRESIKTSTKAAWEDTFNEIKKEGRAVELIYKDNDPDHNTRFVEPIVKQAAQEFGKIVNMLADNGLEDLPKELAGALAKAVLLAHASAVSLETRTAALKHAEEILANQSRTNRIYRPPVGSSAPGSESSAQTQQRLTPAQAGASLINNVLSSRRS